MSRVARSPLPSHNSFISAIRNGDILCRLAAAMNVKAPECEYADEGDAYTIHKIIYFLESCRSAGVNEEDMFAITDLLSNGDDFTGIIRTLMAFDERARRLGFQGPPFPSPPPNIFNSLSPSAKPSAEPRYLENLPSSNRTSSNERYVEEKLIEQPKIQRFTFVQNQTLQRPAGGKNETLYSNNRPKSTGELKREHILQQIISSENLFVGDLLIAVKEFRKTRENPGGLSQADIVALFNNVEELYDIHQDLFKSFVSLPENASASVANILLDFLDPLSHAYLTFTTGTYATLNVLEKRVEDRELDKYLEDFIFSSDSNGISLESYLLRPLDRLEEYEKRLKDLSDVTPADSPSKRMILTAMAELHNVIEDIENQRKKMTTRRTATPSYLIPSVFAQFTDPDNLLNQRIDIQMLESEGRKFLCQGSVWEVINLNEVKVRSLLLFNDILVIAKELSDTNTGRFEVRQVIDLRNIVIRENREKSRKGLKLRPTVLSAVKKFNMNPNNAIDYLIMKRILEDNPGSVASFLHKTPGLSKRQVGKFIGSGENHEILVQYVKRFGSVFAGLRIDEALRLFLLCFRLPGDAQSLDRILKVFASHYYTMNSQYLTSEKAALKLVFSLIILNADLHNEAIPANRKMSLADFIDKLRSTDPALTSLDPTVTIHLPTEMLRDMYDSIAEEKLAMGSDDDTSNSKLEIDIQSIPSKITIQETTDWVSVSIPSLDPYLKLKIYAQDILVDPPVLTFTKSPTQYCKFTGKSIGRKKVYLAPTGKSAGKYQYVIPQTIIVDPPYMKHTFSLEYSAQDKPNGNDMNGRSGSGTSYMFSVATEEQKERWISYVISALEDVRRR
ncbi:hypothetical protein BKA69DRAFT_744171 [Paraphysoderma sedebokerense]|nr:hypothetical protein BKA69DRAFT_744171 [Paraphysoderma sedebokerense]